MKILRPKQTAEILGISVATLYRWHERGILPPKVNFGGSVGYRSDQIEAFIEEHTEKKEEAVK